VCVFFPRIGIAAIATTRNSSDSAADDKDAQLGPRECPSRVPVRSPAALPPNITLDLPPPRARPLSEPPTCCLPKRPPPGDDDDGGRRRCRSRTAPRAGSSDIMLVLVVVGGLFTAASALASPPGTFSSERKNYFNFSYLLFAGVGLIGQFSRRAAHFSPRECMHACFFRSRAHRGWFVGFVCEFVSLFEDRNTSSSSSVLFAEVCE
jgi:hypothetical protein